MEVFVLWEELEKVTDKEKSEWNLWRNLDKIMWMYTLVKVQCKTDLQIAALLHVHWEQLWSRHSQHAEGNCSGSWGKMYIHWGWNHWYKCSLHRLGKKRSPIKNNMKRKWVRHQKHDLSLYSNTVSFWCHIITSKNKYILLLTEGKHFNAVESYIPVLLLT